MDFTPARPDAVRAINQRWLLKFWAQHLDGARVPCWRTVKTDDLTSIADNLSFLDVMRNAPPHFIIRFHGRMIAKVYGSSDCAAVHLLERAAAWRDVRVNLLLLRRKLRYGAIGGCRHLFELSGAQAPDPGNVPLNDISFHRFLHVPKRFRVLACVLLRQHASGGLSLKSAGPSHE